MYLKLVQPAMERIKVLNYVSLIYVLFDLTVGIFQGL